MSKHFSELMLRSAPELSWVESLMLSGVWLGTFALLRYGGAWALEGVVAMNTAVMFALWQQTALRPQKYKKKFLKQLFHSEPIGPRHQPTKHDDDGLSARERPFFNDFEDFAEVVNWRLANPHFGGGPWRLQEEAGSLFECRRSYAIFHNQARLGTLEVSAYDTQTPVLAHVQVNILRQSRRLI